MNGEQLGKERPFGEHRITEIDLSLMNFQEMSEWLHELAEEYGKSPQDVLLCGIDTFPVDLHGTFGDRTETWAFTFDQLAPAAKIADRLGNWTTDSPFYYALATARPGIVLFDAGSFDNLESTNYNTDQSIRSELEYRLKPGVTMDEAAIAVVYITA